MGALMLAITAGFYWKLVFTTQFNWFGSADIALQVLPWFQYEARELHHGRLPLWEAHQWMGQPLLGQAQPGAAYPLNWLLFLLPLHKGLISVNALNWYFVAIHFMAIVFCYALCRDLGRSRRASLIAGCVFGLAGYVGSTDWPQMVNGAVWAPLVLLFLLRAVRGRAPLFSAALSGGLLGVAWLSGHHQIPIFTTLAVAGLWIFFALRGGRIDWSIVRLAAICVVAMFLISALQTLPAYEYGKLARRWVGTPEPIAWDQKVPYSVHTEYSMPGSSLLALVIPGLNTHADPFVGIVAIALALAGFAMAWKERAVRIFTAFSISGLLFSLGFHNIFHGIAYSLVPLVEKARVPSNAIFIFHAGVVVLIAFGVDAFFSDESKSAWRSRIAIGCAIFGAVLAGLILNAALAAKLKFEADDRIALTALFAILLAAILCSHVKGRLTRTHALTAIVILMLVELGNDSGYALPQNKNDHRFPEQYETNADIAQFLKQQPAVFRVDIDDNDLPGNFGDWYGLDMFTGLVASAPTNILALDWSSDRDKMLLGVAYYVGKKPANASQELVFEGYTGLKVYRNPQAFPRAWIVHAVAVVKDAPESNGLIRSPDFDARRTAPVYSPAPPLSSCGASQDPVQIAARTPQSLTLQVDLACDGMVVMSETYFPGWKATIDGNATEIREVYGALRGILAPQGRHEIRMWYRPQSFIFGAMLTFAGVLGICALGLAERKKPSRLG